MGGALLVLAISVGIHGQESAGRTPETVLLGVFTAQQAERGSAIYDAHCAQCHEGPDVDGPPLAGRPFIDRWREDALAGLFDFMKTQMPQQAPGSLSDADYLAIVAHLLRQNSYPPGSRELTIRAARNTLLVGSDGPQPLPAGALVEVVGCLVRNADREWLVSRGGRPSRIRAGNEITATETSAAATASLGAQTFVLQNLDEAASALTVRGSGGQKVLVKGALTLLGTGGRIHVTAAKVLSDTCG